MADVSGFDPYKMLGLKRDATRTQVRRAYLIMAKRHHPDKGGDPERFNAAKRAYDILSDPARRKKFDETGDAEEPRHDNPLGPVMGVIAGVLDEVLDALGDTPPSSIDLIQAIMVRIVSHLKQDEVALVGIRKSLARLKAALGRFDAGPSGQNIMEGILAAKIRNVESFVGHAEETAKIANKAIEILKDYKFRFDAPLPSPAQAAFENAQQRALKASFVQSKFFGQGGENQSYDPFNFGPQRRPRYGR